MLKYVDTLVSFQEVPDEISLCINLSNCPNMCEGCHSSYLREDIGTLLTFTELESLIRKNKGISCIALLGGDNDPKAINELAQQVKSNFPNLQVAWYSGKASLSPDISLENFNYIKLGPYIEDLGPLSSKTTNQTMYQILFSDDRFIMLDITFKFWK